MWVNRSIWSIWSIWSLSF